MRTPIVLVISIGLGISVCHSLKSTDAEVGYYNVKDITNSSVTTVSTDYHGE